MADRQIYLNNNDDQISAQKRGERSGNASGVSSVATIVGGIAVFMLARKKLNLTRAFSSEIKSLGKAGEQFSRYEITSLLKGRSASTVSGTVRQRLGLTAQQIGPRATRKVIGMGRGLANVYQGLVKPIPTVDEQVAIMKATFNKHRMGLRDFPEGLSELTSRWSRWKTYWHGPIRAIAPNAPIVIPGGMQSSGEYGAILAAGNLLKINRAGGVGQVIRGVRGGLAGTMGERFESGRAFGHKVPKTGNIFSFTRRTLAPSKAEVLLEHQRISAEDYLHGLGIAPGVGRQERTTRDVLAKLSAQIDDIVARGTPGAKGSYEFFRSEKDAIAQSAANALNKIVSREAKKPSTKFSHWLAKVQEATGIGEQYARGGSGRIQELWKETKEALEMGITDPVSGRMYRVSHRKYFDEARSITGAWSDGTTGSTFLYQAGGTLKRNLADFTVGTFFKQLEQLTGLGVTVRPNRLTNFISSLVGAQAGSYGEYFIRNYVGGFARLGAVGAGAYVTLKTINYLARSTTGWGPTDVAGKAYTSSREFQQKVLDHLGLIKVARRLEKLFPGLIKSPASIIARATSPLWMMKTGAFLGGRKGGLIGLSLGIATALVTWGDITQSPEELHRIYTGEQDIPVRKGRYWDFGRTPFGGGKVTYWRPHWYPLMRSRYKYQGQLWESEKEKLAQGTMLSPILAPLLTGKAWDPYYWEKKHYYDRPYPVTGELFEPTMPFAWLGNLTLGRLIKPQKMMHPEYFGVAQGESGTSKTIVPGAAEQLGMPTPETYGLLPINQPSSVGWKLGEAAYTMTEQMGLRGWLLNVMGEKLTGRPDFLPQGPVAQSARRATGWERAYWDMNIGDPSETTEFFRRIIPHRRRAVEEYNPIRNQMPYWMPGEDYFINFRTGDPYTKVEMGEARLPGAGYESLHTLHSGIPRVYDAVDRFLILSDVAPYSKEYNQYKYLAIAMARRDKSWQEIVNRHIEQRAKTQQEFEFLELTPPEDVKGAARTLSTAYRHLAAGVSEAGEVIDPFLGKVVKSPISKFFPYKTAKQAYKAYRLHGSEFTNWANPVRDFFGPDWEKLADAAASASGNTHISKKEKERREYEEYFDRLEYAKYKHLEQVAMEQQNAVLARKFRALSKKTMTGVDPTANISRIMGALPKRERAFFEEFSAAKGKDRDDIVKLVTPQMARIYRAQWAVRDGEDRARNADKYNPADETAEFFKSHNLPDENWAGWNPEVDIRDVQLKTVKNEGMNIHDFDLWESQQRALERKKGVPTIDNIMDYRTGFNRLDESGVRQGSIENLRRVIEEQLQNDGYSNTRVHVTRTPAKKNSVNLNIMVKKDRSSEINSNMREMIIA